MIIVEKITKKGDYMYELTLNDGTFKLPCTTYETDIQLGAEFDENKREISANSIENLYKSNLQTHYIGQHEANEKIHVHAEVIDVNKRIVSVGKFQILIYEDIIPRDVLTGDFIEFDVDFLMVY